MRGFSIGDLRIDPRTGRVSGGPGISRHLSPKAIDLLLCLSDRRGLPVSEEELHEKIWNSEPRSALVLNQTINELRRALDDPPEASRIIEKVPGQGYRLATAARPLDKDAADGPAGLLTGPSGDSESMIGQLWQEMKNRKVVRTGIGYLIVAWVILQVAATISDALELPSWSMKFITLLLAIGFVVSIVVSWLVQITQGGLASEKTHGRLSWHELRHYIELSVIIVLLVVVSILTYRQIWHDQPVEESPTVAQEVDDPVSPIEMPVYEGSVAVLPFINLGDDPGDTFFGFGLAEELLHKLSRVKSIKVAARTSSFAFGAGEQDIPAIASRLNVENVLEGSIRRDDDIFRVTAQLVDSDGFHVWSETYDMVSEASIAAQSEIALSVAKKISSRLSADALDQLAAHPTDSAEAYELYLRGLEKLRLPRQPDNLTRAGSFFEQALKIDNRFARAHAAACETELAWFRLNRDVHHFENAERACNRALTLDSGLVEVFIALGNLYRSSSQFDKAEEYFLRAIDLSPYVEEAHYGLARSLQGQGRLREAERILRYCTELEPGYWASFLSLGNFLHRYGRYAEAAEYYTRATELSPENPDGFTNLGTAYFDAGDWEKAEVAWRQAVALAPTPMGYRNMGTLFYYTGRYADALEMHRKAIELAPEDHWLWGKLGAAARYVPGEEETAAAAYEKAIELASERLAVDPEDTTTMAYLAAYYVNAGEESQAERLAALAIESEPANPELWYFAAVVSARLSQHAVALTQLRQAVTLGYSTRLIGADPQFVDLKDMDDFKELLRS